MDASEGLHGPGLRALVQALRDGGATAEDVTHACIDRTRADEGRVRAWAWFDPARALALARAADAARELGTARGALHGVGVALKDIIDAAGLPTGMGSPIFARHVAARSAAVVERLVAAGAFVLGKTATCEFATQHPPATTNPWNPQFTPGGSSSGSAAAVAAGFAPVAIGSQTRGSTIRPAVFCGIVGMKPSFGRVSRFGMLETSFSLDHTGILARTFDDACLVLSQIEGPDPRDRATLGRTWEGGGGALAPLAAPPRLAALRTPAWDLADVAQHELFEANCEALRRVGAQIHHVELPASFAAADAATRTLQLAELARNFFEINARSRDLMSDTFRALYDRGARVGATEYEDALGVQKTLTPALTAFLGGYDAVVTPPAAGEAPRLAHGTGDASFCVIWTLCGAPCVSFPTGLGPQGLPMGLQVVAAPGADRRALEVAMWCSAQLRFSARPPRAA